MEAADVGEAPEPLSIANATLAAVAKTVRGPDGRTWRVRRRWVRHSVRWRGRRANRDNLDWIDVPGDLPLDDEFGCLGGIVVALTIGALIVLSILFVLPAVIFAVEALVVLLLVAGGVLGRVVLRRPWTIEAVEVATHGPKGVTRTWHVVGWKASGRLIDRVTRDIATGVTPRA